MTSLAVTAGGSSLLVIEGGASLTRSWERGQTRGYGLDSIASLKTGPHGSTINLYAELLWLLSIC
jgi:hypothetical protein